MSTLSLPPLSAVRPEKQYDTIMRYLYMLVEELNSRFDEAGSTVEKTVGEGINSFFGDEFGAFSTIQADIGGIRARVADAEGNISTVTQTVNGLTISDGQGQTVINGAKILTGSIDGDKITANTLIAAKISADNIEAGTISATSGSGAINFNGNFNYYYGNRLAGSLGVMVAAQDLAFMELGGPPGGATSKTPIIALGQLGVGYSDSSITQISSHAIRLHGGVTIGDMTDPYADQFTVHNYNELPNPNDYANGTIGIVIL